MMKRKHHLHNVAFEVQLIKSIMQKETQITKTNNILNYTKHCIEQLQNINIY